MKKLIAIITVFFLFACSKSDDMVYSIWDTQFSFSIINSENEDLLNPKTPNHFEADEIKLFYEIDGEVKEIYDPRLDYPRQVRVVIDDNLSRVDLSLNNSDEKSITYVQWNEGDTDTIEVLYQTKDMPGIKRMVWLNGQIIWDLETDSRYYYQIIKESLE